MRDSECETCLFRRPQFCLRFGTRMPSYGGCYGYEAERPIRARNSELDVEGTPLSDPRSLGT